MPVAKELDLIDFNGMSTSAELFCARRLPESDGNERVLLIPPNLQLYWSFIIRLFRTLVGGGPYPSGEMVSVYSTAPADWAKVELNSDNNIW